jgi:branched-chain amino acid transport system permease protein
MNDNATFRGALRLGLIAGVGALSVSVIGMVDLFAQRDLIAGLLSMGQLMVLAPAALAAYMTAEHDAADSVVRPLLRGLLAGLISTIPIAILIQVEQLIPLRQFLLNVSPSLIDILTFGQPPLPGTLLLAGSLAATGLLGAALRMLPDRPRTAVLNGMLWILGFGLLSEVLQGRLRAWFGQGFASLVFQAKALRGGAASLLFVGTAAISWYRARSAGAAGTATQSMPAERRPQVRWIGIAALGLLLVALPLILGTYLSEVVDNIGIYVLMGLGLNIVVGFAGLLDLGYVAFFAIGAYMMAILTSQGSLGISGLSFWSALPFCVAASVTAGLVLGIPVLRMRGDYLAIVTLGFGEIIRILALSDLLKPYIGGAQGVLQIPKPAIFGISLIKPGQLYYVILAGCLLAAFVSWRLADSRLGRRWKALREDEDVAEAMGIRLVSTKLLAFGIGAGFSGLSGAIFASKLTSIFPHSFNLLISINVLCLIIVGGIASLPGVVVGAVILVGLPELLREFNEFRYLMYGALLIFMMVKKPEGFWPSQIRQRELHAGEEDPTAASGELAAAEAGD